MANQFRETMSRDRKNIDSSPKILAYILTWLIFGFSDPTSTFQILRFVTNIGGLVSSRSVRLLDKLESMSEESDTRDKLWLELRKEVRTHMKTLGCTAVIGYR